MNAAWHGRNPMPRNATTEQRVRWHRAHAKYCGCRPIPPPLVALVNAAERRFRDDNVEHPLRRFLVGGDRRSIAQSDKVRARVEKDPRLVNELAALTTDSDWLVQLRAIDLIEKFAHSHPEWVAPYKRIFIGPLAKSDKWEIRLQVVRALPLFRWTPAQRQRAKDILLANVDYPQKFVRVWALDGLATFAAQDAELRASVERKLREFERSGTPSLVARARKIRERLAN